MDNDFKLDLIKQEIADPILFTQFNQSRFFSINFYTPFRSVLLAIYWVLSVRLVWNFNTLFKSGTDDFGRRWLVWIKIFLGFESLLFLPSFLFFWLDNPMIGFQLSHSTLALITLITAISLLFFPQILYGLDREKYELQKVKSKSDKVENLSSQKIKEIEAKLEKVLDQEKKFLQRGYSIHTLSEDMGIPSYLLTIYLNQRLQTNFSDLINQKRVDECCELISSGKYDYLSLLGIAELSGFNNRNSFTQAFQKFKNVSPSLYIKSQKSLSKNKND
jgi:AraC-like DNA-binding protein